MIFEAFDVVVVPFPFTDRRAVKRRPALVVSNRKFNRSHEQIVLAMITSAVTAGWPSDVPVTDLTTAGLPAPSVVRMKLFTLDQHTVLRTAGRLGNADRETVGSGVRSWLL